MSYGEEVAEDYDALAMRGDEAATVAFLEKLTRGGPALELALGTGRIALPLSEQGIQVEGIDFSTAMVAKLQSKPGADKIKVTLGNFADVAVHNTYRLIYVVSEHNQETFFTLQSARKNSPPAASPYCILLSRQPAQGCRQRLFA